MQKSPRKRKRGLFKHCYVIIFITISFCMWKLKVLSSCPIFCPFFANERIKKHKMGNVEEQKTENEHGSVNGKKNTLQVEATNFTTQLILINSFHVEFSIINFIVTFFVFFYSEIFFYYVKVLN